MGLRWYAAIVIVIAIFAGLWDAKDQTVPATKEEWQAMLFYWVTPSAEVIASFTAWSETLQDVVRTAAPFVVAVCRLAYLTVLPVAMGLLDILRKAWNGFYEYVIVRCICSPATIRNVRYCFATAIQWQTSRTKLEIALEVSFILTAIGLYMLVRFLNRQRYLDRSKAWMRRQRRKIQMQYQAFLQEVAIVNRKLAIMTPHAIFWMGIGLFECLFFSFGRWFLETVPATFALDTAKPLILTIQLLLHLHNEAQQQLDNDHRGTRGGKSKKRSGKPNRNAKESKRSSICGDCDDEKHFIRHIHQQDLLNYWVVRGTIVTAKIIFTIVVSLLPFPTKFLTNHVVVLCVMAKAEFYFWMWVNLVPYLTPAFVAQMAQSPIDWLADRIIKPVALDLQTALSLDTPKVHTLWQTTVIFFTSNSLSFLVFSKALSKERADTLNHLAAESRAMVLPIVLVLVYPLRRLGVACVSHILPIAGSLRAKLTPTDESPRTVYHWLQTWVVHVIMSGLLRFFAPFLFFVPFSNVLILSAFAILSLAPPASIDSFYRAYVQEELQIWHVLDPGDVVHGKESYIAVFVDWFLKLIPKASDAEDLRLLPNRPDAAGDGGVAEGDQRNNALPLQPVAENLAQDDENEAEKENEVPLRNLRRRRRETRS